MSRVVITRPGPSLWLASLISVFGMFEVLMAISAGAATTRLIGLVGGIALIIAPWLAESAQRWGLALVLLGIVPLAITTWWSLVTPLVMVVALALWLPLTRTRTAHRSA